MMSGLPTVLLAMLVILIAVAVIAALQVWRRKKEVASQEPIFMHKKAFSVQLAIGIVLGLLSGFLMWNGNILGEDTTGIARVILIIGITLIATSTITGKVIKP